MNQQPRPPSSTANGESSPGVRAPAAPARAQARRLPPVTPLERTEPLPVSFGQQRLWVLERLSPGFAYNVPWFARLRGPLDVRALEQALTALVRRHESLRTTFPEVEGQPVQHVAPALPVTLRVEYLESVPEAERAGVVRGLAEDEAHRPFDLGTGPLFRARLLRVAEHEHVLLLMLHHIACDGWSMGVLERELGALYTAFAQGTEPSLPALPVQYVDFAAWQRGWLRDVVLEQQLAWWKQHLAGAPPELELPTDRPRPPVKSTRGAVLAVPLSPELSRTVRERCGREGVTPFMALLAGFQALLARYSGQEDFVVGTPFSGRNRRELEGLVGYFANTLALRAYVPPSATFRELLQQVRGTCMGAFAHPDLPFEQLVDALQPTRDLSRTPLFQVSFVLQAEPLSSLRLPGVTVEELAFEPGVAKSDLTLFLRDTPRGLVGLWEYDTALFDASTLARMASHYARLLTAALANPEQRLSRLPLLDDAERQQTLVAWNSRRRDYPRDTCAHHLIEAQVQRTPDAIAVRFEDQRLTYGELNRRANQLAHHLRALGVGPEVPVGLSLERSPELAVGILGILKAGGAYVPQDPSYPAERLAFMLQEARMPVLVTMRAVADTLPSRGERRVCLDAEAEVLARQPGDDPRPTTGSGNLAYIIFTSGSTGRPKGTLLTHRGLCNTALAAVETRHVRPDSRVLQFAAFSFDSSVSDIFSTLFAGGCLVMAARDSLQTGAPLRDLLRREQVTLVTLTPAVLAQQEPGGYPALETVISGGEACTPELVRRWKPGRRFLNEYGPTEITVCATIDEDVREERPTIGRPLPNVQVYVLDAELLLVPTGVSGELYVGGEGLARGYLGRPELTAEKFVPNPFSDTPGARLYRTGDIARWLPTGELDYVGRADGQVKVRGFRIELGEVEAVLRGHPAVKEAVVVARKDSTGSNRLVAYVVPNTPLPPGEGRGEERRTASLTAELRAHLRQHLPEHMVPSAFVHLAALPLTPNGKVDRRALPAPEHPAQDARDFVAPRTALEQQVADVWAALLELERVGVRDSFFELGGHSLLAARVMSRLREQVGVELPVRALFEAPTVAGLAERLQPLLDSGSTKQPPPLAPMARPEAVPLSFAQQRLWFIDRFEPGGFAYNMPLFARLQGALDVGVLEHALRTLVSRHEALRTTFTQVDGTPVQRLAREQGLALQVEDLEALPESLRDAEALQRAQAEARRPFDLGTGPLLRARLLRASPVEHVLVLTMHHIVSDGWSLGVMLRELEACYGAFARGTEPSLPALPVQYADFALWQRAWLQGEVLEQQLAWWKQHLAGAPPVLELPTDRPRPPVQSFQGAFLRVPLSPELSRAVRSLGTAEDATPFMVLLAGFHALLARYSGQEDVVVGSPSAGRTRRELEGLIGFFVNTLPLRAQVDGEGGFRGLLDRVREACLGAFAHQDVPFERLVEALRPERDPSRPPLFQVSFAMLDVPLTARLGDVSLRALDLPTGMAKFDLTLFVREAEQGFESFWEYSTALLDEATVARLAAHYTRLLEAAVARPEQPVSGLPLLSDAERRQFLVGWNDTRTDFPRQATLPALFAEQVALRPDAIAVEYDDEALTYAQLDRRANQLAWHLRGLGIGPGTPVGLCVERSVELGVALLGILKAGGAYVPLDPDYPRERLSFMLEDTGVPVVLASPRLESQLPPGSARVVALEPSGKAFAHEREDAPAVALAAQSLAHIIYTSGSTGRPKGVCIPHQGVVRLVRDTNYLRVTPEDRLGQTSNIAFDAATFEVWGALLNGARLVGVPRDVLLSPRALAEHVRHHQLTVLFVTTAVFHQVVAECPDAFQSLACVLTGGDAMDVHAARRLLEHAAPGRLLNIYGPTECTAYATWYEVKQVAKHAVSVPIGTPVANTDVYVLDGHLRPVPVGVTGELYLGGEGLAWGYLNRPELTAERFIPHPFSAVPGARLYGTGDLARFRADGTVEFLGRRDTQVKVRGFRIELGEVEAALLSHPAVKEAVVLARQEPTGHKRLVAYVVPTSPLPLGEGRGEGSRAPALDLTALRAHLKRHLPDYMLPAAFVRLESLPLTPNGKVDRKALPAPEPEAARADVVPPRTAMEKVVASIWAPLLGLSEVGANDHFFERGGHSLMATQVASRLREVLQDEVPVRILFEAPTVAELASKLETLPRAESVGPVPRVVPLPRNGPLPQSFAQQRLWFISQIDTTGFAYNVPVFTRLHGPLDVAALERALRDIIQRHESLRTTFAEEDGQPVQRITPELPFTLAVEDLESLPADAREEAIRQRAEAEARRPFDLREGPLVRGGLLRVSAREHVLLVTLHHIISDGWSLGVLMHELKALYTAHTGGNEPALPPLPVQYADYTQWQRGWLQGKALEKQLDWWKRQLAGVTPVLELPTDRPRPPTQTFLGRNLRVQLSQELSRALSALSRKEGVTLFMTLLAGFQALLARHSGQEDIVVGSPISGRTRRELEGLIGFFVNTLALRTPVSPSASFRQLLLRVRDTCLGAFAHQDLPFERIVDAVQPTRDLSRTPLFQVMFVLQNSHPAMELPGLTAEEVGVEAGFSKFDLTLFARETPQGLVAFWEYNSALYDEATVARMASHYTRLLESAVARPDEQVAALPLLPDAERHQVVTTWNSLRDDTYVPGLMHGWVEAQVARTPHAIAVTDGEASLTYAQLDARANQLARHLIALGVPPNGTVGLCLERSSLDMPVAVLATLKAGAAFLPLDPNYPADRLALMLEDTGAPVVLAHSALVSALPTGCTARLVRLEEEATAIAARPDTSPALDVSPETNCYFVYTSGSTGRPKGIVMSHRAVGNMLWWLLKRAVKPDATTLQFASLNFDVSFQEMFGTWSLGGRVLLITTELRRDPPAMLRYMVHHRVERLYLPFVALQAVCDAALTEPELPPLNEVITAGEQLQVSPALVSFFERLPGCMLENQYGPSEAHVVTAWRARGVPSSWPALPPVGAPLSNTQILVLDPRGEPCPIGVPGEVYVGGTNLAHGYHGRPDLTADRFVPSHFPTAPGQRLYRTGDKARWLADGHLEFLGRLDGQIKLRGFRIELGEVEAALRAQPGVRDAVAVVREDSPGDRRLVGYVVPISPLPPGEGRGEGIEAPALDLAALRTNLQHRLPEYMLPSALVRLDAMPLMPTGKVDRKNLPPPPLNQEPGRAYVAPRTALELQLVRLWEEVLGIQPIGVRDHFFALGGHSLMAIRLLSRVRAITGRALPVAALFQHATVEELAALLRQEPRPWTPLVEFRGGTARRPFFCVHPVGGTVLSYHGLARALGPDQPFYGLQSRGLEDDGAPCKTVPEMAALYLEAVCTVQPRGPYLLGGWSMGGLIALEMATQLQRQGESVELVALIDSYARPFPKGQTPQIQYETTRWGALFYKDLLRAAGQPLPLPDEELNRLAPEAMLRVLEEASRSTDAVPGVAVQPLQALRQVFETNLLAAWTYETPAYPGPVLSLESSESPRPHEWEERLTGPLEVQVVPGDHYSILRGPELEVLASRLRASLERAHAAGPAAR